MQIWSKMDFGTGTVTFLDDTRKEDMLQVEYPNCFLLDMGWYQDRYIISIIHIYPVPLTVNRRFGKITRFTITMTFSVLLSGCRHPGGEW